MSDRKAWDIIEWASKVLAIDEKGTNSTLSRDLIGAAKTLEQAGVAWISVKDRLPEPYKQVVAFDGIEIDIAWVDDDLMWQAGYRTDWEFFTHWMPLPPLPKEEGDE